MQEVSLAPLTVADAAPLAVLQNRLWRETYAGLIPAEVLAERDDERNIACWQERARVHEESGTSPDGARTLVAHEPTGAPIGWVSIGPPRDDAPPTPTELWSLYVAQEHHGRGVAAALVAAALPSSDAAHLWVFVGNERAIAFYRKLGFRPDGTIAHDAPMRVDELRMVRRG